MKKVAQRLADFIIYQIDSSNDLKMQIAWIRAGQILDYICRIFNTHLT